MNPENLSSDLNAVTMNVRTSREVSGADVAESAGPVDAKQNGDTSDDDVTRVRVPLTRWQFAFVYLGLGLAILLASLDQTIVATALRSIVTDFGHQDLVPWIGSSYLITACSLATLYGKFADIFGRKWVFVSALVIFETGSLVCGVATSMEMLIAGRAIAGAGGGGIFSLVLIIISDIVSIQDRGKYQGILGAFFGLSSVIGPLVGGAFSDHISWRWCFFINLPLGAVTILTVILLLKFPATEGSLGSKIRKIDFLGTIVFFIAIITLLTPLQLGGSVWAWNAPQTIACFPISALFFALFWYIESRVAKEPIIPPALFRNSSVTVLVIISILLGAAFFSGSYYISLFFQVVNRYSATDAGIAQIPIVFGLILLSISSGQIVSRTGQYKAFFFIGPLFLIAGSVLISTLDQNSQLVQRIFYLAIFGMGAGSMIQLRVLALQASVSYEMIAVATAVAQTCQTFGGALGVSITGTIFNNVLVQQMSTQQELVSVIGKLEAFSNQTLDSGDVIALQAALDQANMSIQNMHLNISGLQPSDFLIASNELVESFREAYHIAYLCILPLAVLIFLMAFFIKQVKVAAKKNDMEFSASAAH